MITKKEQEANELKHFNKAAGKLSAVALSAGALALSCPTYAFASQEGGIEAILPEMKGTLMGYFFIGAAMSEALALLGLVLFFIG